MSIPISQGNTGLTNKRWVAVTGIQEVFAGAGGLFSFTLRNAIGTATPVWLNIYNMPANLVQVGGVGGSPVSRRIAVPGSTSAVPGEKVQFPAVFPLHWFSKAMTIAPVTSDSDAAAVGGSLYVEMDVAPDVTST